MKSIKLYSTALAAVLVGTTLAGCAASAPADNGKLQIVTTLYPQYNWVQEILGDNPAGVELTPLLDSGADMHSYQPTAAAMLTVSDCDLFVYTGGTSDSWVADALKQGTNPDRAALNLLDVLGERAKEEELVEGMQGEGDDHDHGETPVDGAEAEHEEEIEYDEHIWLSLKNADLLCAALAEQIAALDPENAALYAANADTYRAKLRALDAEYAAAVAAAPQSTLLFGDRFPFRYLVEDYDLNYYAAFVGCSAETEASFETVRFLAGKLGELDLHHVCVLESSDSKLAHTIIDNSGVADADIVTFDSMQSATTADAAGHGDYLRRMQANLTALQTALS